MGTEKMSEAITSENRAKKQVVRTFAKPKITASQNKIEEQENI